MTEIAHSQVHVPKRDSVWTELVRKDDWWAIWIGLGLVVVAAGLVANGSSLKWLAVAPQKWTTWPEALAQVRAHAAQYLALFVLWAALFGIGVTALGYKLSRFLPAFALVFVVSLGLYLLGQWDQAAHYNLEPPLVALVLGLLVANTVGVPQWADAGLRVELYIKTGIVLLGASLPLTLIAWAGPVATLGTGGAVCGVSGAIATAGAVGARKEHASIAISLVIFWAILAIFILPLLARGLQLPTGVAGAWIGTSEFADAAGLAAAQAYGGPARPVAGEHGT